MEVSMKKLISGLLAAAMLLAFSACGGSNANNSTPNAQSAAPQASSGQAGIKAPAAAKKDFILAL